MRGHLDGRITLIFPVNKRFPAGFLVESIEQHRRDTLKAKLSQWLKYSSTVTCWPSFRLPPRAGHCIQLALTSPNRAALGTSPTPNRAALSASTSSIGTFTLGQTRAGIMSLCDPSNRMCRASSRNKDRRSKPKSGGTAMRVMIKFAFLDCNQTK
jgi:hypothetical protein